MADAGFGPLRIVLWLTGFSFAVGLLVAQCLRWDVPEPILLGSYLALCLGWYLLTRNRARAVAFFRVLRRLPPEAQTARGTLP